MSHRFGTIRQIGFVVRDAPAAMLYWATEFGVGPFFVAENATFTDYRYRDRPAPSPVLTLGYAQTDDLQIEIIAQHNDAPSGYLDFLASGREGCQHLSSWFDSNAAYDAARDSAQDSGAELLHEGSAGGPRFAYFSTGSDRPYGVAFEIAEGLLPQLAPVRDMLSQAARTWDGSDPIRPMR